MFRCLKSELGVRNHFIELLVVPGEEVGLEAIKRPRELPPIKCSFTFGFLQKQVQPPAPQEFWNFWDTFSKEIFFWSLGFALGKSLTLLLSTMSTPVTLSLENRFSTLPLQFSTGAFKLLTHHSYSVLYSLMVLFDTMPHSAVLYLVDISILPLPDTISDTLIS